MITKEEFINRITSLPVDKYMDVNAEDETGESIYVFGCKKLFGEPRIVYICPQNGEMAIVQDTFVNTIDEYLEHIYDELVPYYEYITLSKPFEMKDWD